MCNRPFHGKNKSVVRAVTRLTQSLGCITPTESPQYKAGSDLCQRERNYTRLNRELPTGARIDTACPVSSLRRSGYRTGSDSSLQTHRINN